jgi:heme exporter protein D
MMPELGRYALEVTSAYIVSLAVLAALVAAIWRRGVRVRAQLSEIEARRRRGDA